jgi:hypothetical protein
VKVNECIVHTSMYEVHVGGQKVKKALESTAVIARVSFNGKMLEHSLSNTSSFVPSWMFCFVKSI